MKIGDKVYVRGYVDEIRKDTIIIRNDGGYFGTVADEILEQLLTIEPERKTGKWTTEEVAELLFNLFGEECACNFSGIDEWLPERCKYTESTCPDPPGKHGCWMQFLLQGGANMRQEGGQ